jgi:flagellar assembly protein FliH
MPVQAKYLFDQDFAPEAKTAEKARTAAELALMLAEAESKGYRDGFAAAELEGTAVATRRVAVAFEQIGDALTRLSRGLATIEARLETESVELAAAIARKLAPELVAREPFVEIAALATECLRHLAASPHVVVRVNDSLHEIARGRLDEIARARGFEGRLMVLAEPEIAVGDCKIEWADGGVVRNAEKTDLAIGHAIGRYLARKTAVTPALGELMPGLNQETRNE